MKRSCRDGLVAFALLAAVQSAAADELSDWNERVIGFAIDGRTPPTVTPPVAGRLIAMMQVAMRDAVNSIDRKYRLYLVQLPAEAAVTREAAAATAYAYLDRSSLMVAATTAAASLLAPATTASIDVPGPTIDVLT